MEIYDDKQTFETSKNKGKKCDKKIELEQVKSIKTSSENTAKGAEYQIEIRLNRQRHILMFNDEADFKDWFGKLNAAVDISDRGSVEGSTASIEGDDSESDNDEVVVLNQMYASTEIAKRFLVVVQPSDLAKLCGIEGEMTLLVGNTDLAFECPKTKRIKYTFQLSWMRRFGKYKTHNFNFEVGRKCPNGDGNITCLTEGAKLIHKLVTEKSSSHGKTVIPHRQDDNDDNNPHFKPAVPDSKPAVPDSKPAVKPREEKPPDLPPIIQERQPTVIVQAPPTNLIRKHPGKAKLPNLIPITPQNQDDVTSAAPKSPVTPPAPQRRGSKGQSLSKSKDNDSKGRTLAENGHLRPASYKVAVGSEFTKELEEKLHQGPTPDDSALSGDSGKGHEPKKEDSLKTKEEKRKEKEEKKRREKEEKKEKEREEKERKQREKEEKEEKEREEKERKQREKQEKKMSKVKDTDKKPEKSKFTNSSFRSGNNIYDEPELMPSENLHGDLDAGPLYDEATSPRPNIPTEYAQPLKKSARGSSSAQDNLYDEGISSNTGSSASNDTVTYAEPYAQKGRAPGKQEPVTYAEVGNVKKGKPAAKQQPATYAEVSTLQNEAWKVFGDEEKFHEEDYSNIKKAREQMVPAEPPIPVRDYDEEEIDDTYDKVGFRNLNQSKSNTANIYGTASATKVGDLSNIVQIPEADYHSSSDAEEENQYDDPQYEGYAVPSEVLNDHKKVAKVSDAYEEATPCKSASVKQKPANSIFYEEIN